MFWNFNMSGVRTQPTASPRGSRAFLTGTQLQVYKPRRLTVAELERYIRTGCVCSVCEFARAEIHARQ